MILGVGIDLLDIKRVDRLYSKFKEKFAERILSKEEFSIFKNYKDKVKFLAKRFSSKESFSKAVGTGIGRGINFNDISIVPDILGKPILSLSHEASYFLETIFRKSFDKLKIDLSTTDENGYINTIVLISCL